MGEKDKTAFDPKAAAEARKAELEEITGKLEKGEDPFLVILDGVTDPQNLGAVIRTAACVGAHGVIVPERRAVGLTPSAVKASAGALLRMPVAKVGNLRVALYYFRDSEFQIVAASEKAEDTMYELNLKKATAIVMGSEGTGISEPVLSLCTVGARIPMAGETGSLNVSVAAAILLFEVVRQRIS